VCARTLSFVLLVACTPPEPERAVVVSARLATLRVRAPHALAAYDVSVDQWIVATPGESALVTAAPDSAVASPDAFAHVVTRGAMIISRESLSDGFAVTLQTGDARTTYVVKELGSRWIACTGSVALCKSLKRA
jgi:hypothetical protein